MEKREVFAEPNDFSQYVDRATQSIHLFEAKLNEPDINPTHRRRLRYTVFRERFQLFIARYSRGEAISELETAFPMIVLALSDYQNEEGAESFDFQDLDHYVQALWLLSLAILLKTDDTTIHQLLKLINQDGKDGLFERLAALCVSQRSEITQLAHSDPYLPLYEALDKEDPDRTQYIDKFLKQYYRGMKPTYWYDAHKKGTGSFFGYWCFELAAFVQGLNINDISFADNIFYPRDLTGRELLKTWEDSKTGEAARQAYKTLKASVQAE